METKNELEATINQLVAEKNALVANNGDQKKFLNSKKKYKKYKMN